MALRRGITRRVSRQIHRWLGIGLLVGLMPLAVSGLYLMVHEEIDALIAPARYAVTDGPAVPAATLLARAQEAVGPGFVPSSLRLPESDDDVAVATLREAQGAPGRRPRSVSVYLDPANGRAPEVVDMRKTLYGTMHLMHEHFMVPEYSGRSYVGWAGVGMFLLSITGVIMWWPRNGAWRRALKWRRSTDGYSNLHQFTGFLIALPLAIVSLTGIVLAFPQQSRELMRNVAPVSTPQRGGGGLLAKPALTIDTVMNRAAGAQAGRVAQVWMPMQNTAQWRVEIETPAGETAMQLVDDRTGAVSAVPRPQSGDAALAWIWWIHEGSHLTAVWWLIVFATGVLPVAFGITGIVIWLRQRRVRRLAGTGLRGTKGLTTVKSETL